MAISYNDWKKSYEELDAAWKQKFVDLAKNSDIGKQYMQQYASEIGGSKNTWTTTSSNTWSTYTNNNTSNTWTSTSTTGTTGGTTWTTWTTSTNNTAWYNQVKPEEVSTRTNANNVQVNDLAYQWNKLSYEQQQEKLKQTPALKQSLANLGITIKWPESTTWTTWTSGGSAWTTWGTTGWTTGGKGWDEWDYQDNSQARMDEILKHLNEYRVTNPSLFSNYDDFYNFFIEGKGRSPEQIKVLNDYFKNTKAYNSYDNMSSSDIGYLMVHWGNSTVDDYVNLLKSTDPQRYAEIQTARKDEEDKIKSNSTLDTISDMMWEWDNETLWKNKVLNWMKENWMFVDKDWNLVDDRLENYASEEEKGYQKEIADLYADILDIDNTVKHTYEDLRDRYPWASKSTLMAMANDRNSDLLREREDKMVTITKLQGYVGYMQENRKEMNDAGKLTIANLQKQYWMYYEYSPEGIKERAKALAEAEYESTHVTLDQADNGTDTEKQMALQSVLDGYYQKYWDIIERSEQQVIWDVMRLAKEKGISLSDALEENFLQYLRAKPWFKKLNTVAKDNPDVFKIWENAYAYWDDNWNLVPIWWTLWGSGSYWANWVYQFSDWELREVWADGKYKDTIWNDINSIWHILNSNDWLRVWTYTSPNWYTYNVYATREDWIKATENLLRNSYYWMSLWDAAQKWIGQGKDISEAKRVIASLWLNVNDKLSDDNARKFIEAMGKWEWTLKWWQSLDDWAKWGKDLSSYKTWGANNSWYDPELEAFFQKDPTKLTKDQWNRINKMWYDERTYLSMRNNYLTGLAKNPDWTTVKILDTLWYLMTNYPWRLSLMSSWATQYLPTEYWEDMWDYKSYLDYIKQNLTMDNLTKLKANGATFGSLTEWEWPRIEASASRLSSSMSEEKFLEELLNIYNAYAEKSWMWNLTLDDINNMYGWSNTTTTTQTQTLNAPWYVWEKLAEPTVEDWSSIIESYRGTGK